MLTRELLVLRRQNGFLKPGFQKPAPPILALCRTMLEIFREARRRGTGRAELEEMLDPLLKGGSSPKVAAGLRKLLADHCEFAVVNAPEECAALREKVLLQAARLLADPPADYRVYRRKALENVPENVDFYGDLPEYESLISVPEWTEEEFLNRYNIALIQTCLVHSDSLEVTLEAAAPMELRKFMRRLKFFRLLAEVVRCDRNRVRLRLSGPGAIFSENRKYGLQLAAFFPVILLCSNWSVRAKIALRGTAPEILVLNPEKCPFRSHYQRWSTYVPEEVALFLKSFQQTVTSWRCDAESPLPGGTGEEMIFPDFSFVAADDPDRVIHVELFHRWHASPLEKRLALLREKPALPLILGIDRSLLGKDGEADFRSRWGDLERHFFFFSSYPGVERVKKMLECFGSGAVSGNCTTSR